MSVLRPRHLLFEDLSGTLHKQEPHTTVVGNYDTIQSLPPNYGQESIAELEAQLSILARELHGAHDALQGRVDTHKKAVLEQLEATGGRLALESHLKAQKANWKFIGQKEAFLVRLQELGSYHAFLQQDFLSDMSKAEKSVQALKEDIRDRHAAISKTEQELRDMISQLTRLHQRGKSAAADLAIQLPLVASDLEAKKAKRQQPPDALVQGMSEAQLQRLVEQEELCAAQLEQELAQEGSNSATIATEYAMLEARLRDLSEEVAAAEDEFSAAAEKAGAKYTDELQRFDWLGAHVERTCGVQVANRDHCIMEVTISQVVPRGMPARDQVPTQRSLSSNSQPVDVDHGAIGAVVVEHVLSLHFEEPGSARLCKATLTPEVVKIDQYVHEAQLTQRTPGSGSFFALCNLVMAVKRQIWIHCRRQLQLEDAHELYPLQPIGPSLLRCVLPNKVELEVQVPLVWPEDPDARLELIQLQASRASKDLAPLLASLQRELEEAYSMGATGAGGIQAEMRRRQLRGCSLREFVGWVYRNVEAEEQAVQ